MISVWLLIAVSQGIGWPDAFLGAVATICGAFVVWQMLKSMD